MVVPHVDDQRVTVRKKIHGGNCCCCAELGLRKHIELQITDIRRNVLGLLESAVYRRTTLSRFPIVQNGKRVWVEKPDMAHDNGAHFPVVGKQFTEARAVRSGRVGNADALLFSTRDLVDFAKSYFLRTLAPG